MLIFLDENLSEYVAEALNLLNRGYFPDVEVISTKKQPGQGVPDEELIPYISTQKGIIVTRDKGIANTQIHYELCQKYNVSVISIKLTKGSKRHWDMVKLLIKNWELIIKKVNSLNPPFNLSVTPRGVIRIK